MTAGSVELRVRVDTSELDAALARAERYAALITGRPFDRGAAEPLAYAAFAGIVLQEAGTPISRRNLLRRFWGGRK